MSEKSFKLKIKLITTRNGFMGNWLDDWVCRLRVITSWRLVAKRIGTEKNALQKKGLKLSDADQLLRVWAELKMLPRNGSYIAFLYLGETHFLRPPKVAPGMFPKDIFLSIQYTYILALFLLDISFHPQFMRMRRTRRKRRIDVEDALNLR